MFIATAIAVIFASLALCLTYSSDHGNINMKSSYAIFFVTTVLIALVVPPLFVVGFKELKITRTKRDLIFGRVASMLLLLGVFTFTLTDMVYMTSGSFEAWRFFRALVAIFVAIFALLEFLPSKTKVSSTVKNFVNGCVPVYTALSILALYFNPTYVPEYFKILYVMAYSILTLFFLYDFKWRLVKTNAKAYTAISAMTFVFSAIVSLASIIGFIFKNGDFSQSEITVSLFEMIFVLILGIYALSKVFAIKKTIEYVIVETHKRNEEKKRKEEKRQAEEDARFEAMKAQLEEAKAKEEISGQNADN